MSDSELPRDRTYGYDAAGNLTAVPTPSGPRCNTPTTPAMRWSARGTTASSGLRLRTRPHRTPDQRDRLRLAGPGTQLRFRAHRTESLVDNLYRIESPSGLVTRFAYDENRQLTQAASAQTAATTVAPTATTTATTG